MKNKLFVLILLIFCLTGIEAFARVDCGMLLVSNAVKKSEKYCSEEKPFYGTGCGGCFGCDEKEVLPVREADLADIQACKNRAIIKSEWGDYESILTQCPADAPLRTKYGDCVPCNSAHRVYVKDSSDCDVCSDMSAYSYESSYSEKKGWYCMRNICPETHPIRGKYACYKCDDVCAINTSPEECAKCPNRQMQKVYKNDLCILIDTLDPRKPLIDITPAMTSDMGGDTEFCSFPESCDTYTEVETIKENCDKCPNREYKDGKCVLASCDSGKIKTGAGCLSCDDVWWRHWSKGAEYYPTKDDCDKCPNRGWDEKHHECRLIECPDGYFKEGEGCSSCDKGGRYAITTAEECAKCPNRTYEDGECFIKGK